MAIENTDEGYVNPKFKDYISADDIFEEDVFGDETNDELIDDENLEMEIIDDNFDEVLELTSVSESSVISTDFSGSSNMMLSEYKQIDSITITEKQTKLAQKFIKEVSSFIKNCDDVNLSANHKKFIDTIADLKLANLADLLILREMNKELIANIILQINSTGGEDFVLINNYIALSKNQQELVKNTNSLINSLPNEMKNLRNDILTQNELSNADKSDLSDVVSPSQNVHNNGKTLLKQIQQMQQLKEGKNNENKNS